MPLGRSAGQISDGGMLLGETNQAEWAETLSGILPQCNCPAGMLPTIQSPTPRDNNRMMPGKASPGSPCQNLQREKATLKCQSLLWLPFINPGGRGGALCCGEMPMAGIEVRTTPQGGGVLVGSAIAHPLAPKAEGGGAWKGHFQGEMGLVSRYQGPKLTPPFCFGVPAFPTRSRLYR